MELNNARRGNIGKIGNQLISLSFLVCQRKQDRRIAEMTKRLDRALSTDTFESCCARLPVIAV